MNATNPQHARTTTATTRAARIGLELFAGIGAAVGGVGLIADNWIGMPADWLAAIPFPSWVLPGVSLLALVATPMLVAAAAELSRRSWARWTSLAAGMLLVEWIVAQWLIIGRFNWLQPTMLAVGAALVLLSWIGLRTTTST